MRISTGDYLDHLRAESGRFAAAVAAADLDAPVPSRPGWTCADLLWHLAEVQWFWASIVRTGIVETEQAEQLVVDRPSDERGLWSLFHESTAELLGALAQAAPASRAWTWAPEDQTVGFILRRQTHEALVHRVDAEVVAGVRSPLDNTLAADGVDEALRVMYGETTGPGPVGPVRSVRLASTDTGHTWRLTLAQSGSDGYLQVCPEDDGGPVAATVTADAADLNCWLWNRPATGPVCRSGDPDALAAVDALLALGAR